MIDTEVFGEWRITPRWFGIWPVSIDWTPRPATRRMVLYLPGTGRGMTVWLHPLWVWLHGPAAWRAYLAEHEPYPAYDDLGRLANCQREHCGHSPDWHRLDDSLNISPVDPAAKFRCIIEGCACPDFLDLVRGRVT